MKTKDLIAKRLRREKAIERRNRNQQTTKQRVSLEPQEQEYVIPAGFSEDVS